MTQHRDSLRKPNVPVGIYVTTRTDWRERYWDALIWLRCHVLRRHSPQSAHDSRQMVPLIDRRNNKSFYEFRRNGRLECSGCKRDLGSDPDGVGEWR